ncbi:MAG: hypothetical protein ACRC3H_12135 [Lachnospiraceae bacterium]
MPENEKRMAGEYQVFQTIHLGDKEIIIGEKPDAAAKDRYLCAFCEVNDLFTLYTEGYTGEYLDIMQLFHKVKLSSEGDSRRTIAERIQGLSSSYSTALRAEVLELVSHRTNGSDYKSNN